jgi:hypothetical protein
MLVLLSALALADPGLAGGKPTLQTATVEELAAIPGVGSEAAAAIVGLRTSHGGISSVEELRVLPGLDGETLDALRRGTVSTFTLTTEKTPVDVTAAGSTRTFASAEDVLSEFAKEPSVQDVQHWADDYARTSPELVDRWMRESRLFGALPQVKIEYRDDYDNNFKYKYYADDGLIDQPGEPVGTVLNEATEGSGNYIKGTVEWQLADLVMSTERIRVLNEVQDVVKLRDKVMSEATTVFFERRRLQVDMLLNPKVDLRGQVIDQLRLMELTANIDALTGGMFSANVK